LSNAGRAEFEIEEDRLDASREATISRCASAVIDAALTPLLSRHFREKEGNLVPNREASPVKGDSTALRFRCRGLDANSPSLKKPSAKS
jgi:hypothetical protein